MTELKSKLRSLERLAGMFKVNKSMRQKKKGTFKYVLKSY
jgi:hypothetical protein